MFVVFRQVPPPNAIDASEGRLLINALRRRPTEEDAAGLVTPRTRAAEQAALKIQKTVETEHGKQGEVDPALDDEELNEVLAALKYLAAEPGTTDRLRCLEDNLGVYLGGEPLG